jgi:hypothetical protein
MARRGNIVMRTFAHLAVLLTALAPSAVFAAPEPDRITSLPKKVRFVSLAEARAIALEQGSVGQPSLLCRGFGFESDGMWSKDAAKPVLASVKPGSKDIILTGITRNPRPAGLERNINQMLLNVENAYWNLYGSYWQLYSREQGLRLAYETWKVSWTLHEKGTITQAALAQAEGQYNLFRSQRLQALDCVMDNERQLRAMLGMKIADTVRLVPSDAPSLVEKKADWKKALDYTLKHRPELHMARMDVPKACAALREEEACDIQRACVECAPDEPSRLRQAKLQVARATLVEQDQELKAERFLGLYYRRQSSAYFQIKAARAQRESFAKQLQVRDELYHTGGNASDAQTPVTLNLLLESQRFWAEALATEYQAIVTYNNAIAGWAYAQGKIMQHAHVRFGDEPPEGSNTVRAVERERKRTRHNVRCETGLLTNSPLTAPDACMTGTRAAAPSIAALWKCFPPMEQATELPSCGSDYQDEHAIGLTTLQVSDIFPPRHSHAKTKP